MCRRHVLVIRELELLRGVTPRRLLGECGYVCEHLELCVNKKSEKKHCTCHQVSSRIRLKGSSICWKSDFNMLVYEHITPETRSHVEKLFFFFWWFWWCDDLVFSFSSDYLCQQNPSAFRFSQSAFGMARLSFRITPAEISPTDSS